MKQVFETLEQLGYYISFNTINTIQYDKTSDSHKFLNLNDENIKAIYKNMKIFFQVMENAKSKRSCYYYFH